MYDGKPPDAYVKVDVIDTRTGENILKSRSKTVPSNCDPVFGARWEWRGRVTGGGSVVRRL